MVSWASCHMVQMLAEYHWFYSRKEREVRWLGGGSEKLPRVLPVQLRGEYDCIWEYCFPLTSTEILEETILWTLYFYRKDMMLRGYITCSRPDENEDTIKAVDIRSSASSLVVFLLLLLFEATKILALQEWMSLVWLAWGSVWQESWTWGFLLTFLASCCSGFQVPDVTSRWPSLHPPYLPLWEKESVSLVGQVRKLVVT